MPVDCIPHASVVHHHPAAYHRAAPRRPRPIRVAAVHAVAHLHAHRHVRPRECPPGAAAIPLAELSNDNVGGLYLPASPLADNVVSYASPAAALVSDSPFATAEASGLDLPFGPLYGGSGGGGSSAAVVGRLDTPGDASGSSGGAGGGASPGSGGGSSGGGGISQPATSTPTPSQPIPSKPTIAAPGASGPTTPTSAPIVVPGDTPVVGVLPAGPSDTLPGTGPGTGQGAGPVTGPAPLVVGVSGVPEPATWAFMIIGLGGVGAVARRGRPRREAGLAA